MTSFFQQLTKPSPTNAAPPPSQTWRNDLAVLATVLFALFLGVGVRNQILNASQYITLGDNYPRLSAPAGWLTKQADSGIFQVRNPATASTFASEVDITVRPLEADETLEMARFAQSLQRSKDLQNYREFTVDQVVVRPTIGRTRSDEVPGVLATYAYIADPSLDSNANGLPVVVQAQDLLFILDKNLYTVTLMADATQWAQETKHFSLLLDSLGMKQVAQDAAEGSVQP